MKKPIDLSQIPADWKQWAMEINDQYYKTQNWWWALYVIYNLYQYEIYKLKWNRNTFRDKITPICHALAKETRKEREEMAKIMSETFRQIRPKDPEPWEVLAEEYRLTNRDENGDRVCEIYLACT